MARNFLILLGFLVFVALLPLFQGAAPILPPLLAIGLALITREVLLSLFLGVVLGASWAYGWHTPWGSFQAIVLGTRDAITEVIPSAIADPDHAAIILFSVLLGGMVGIISRSGAAAAMVRSVSRYVRGERGAQVAGWLAGLVIFFDDYANTLLVGNTMRPLFDRWRISREKLSYIVDSTAAPVAAIAIVSTWIGYEIGLIGDAFRSANIGIDPFWAFLQSIPTRYYSIYALFFVLFIALVGKDFGAMLRAEARARIHGKVLDDQAVPLFQDQDLIPVEREGGRAHQAWIPILVVVLATLGFLYLSGKSKAPGQGLLEIIGAANSFYALTLGSFLGVLTALLLVLGEGVMNLREAMDAWLKGGASLFLALVVLTLAWSLGAVLTQLKTAEFVTEGLRGAIPPWAYPTLVFLTAAFISFATGTSWGTMAILFPIAIPLVHASGGAEVLIPSLAGILSGATFGDHCSPISDTTIMSSMASGADHIDHVRTQLPYAITAAAVSIVLGYFPAGFGVGPLVLLPLGLLLLWVLLQLLGKRPEEVPE